jgi:hypothetical protein
MEKLEKRRPINKRVKEIKNFISKIKSEAFGEWEFSKDFGGMIDERALSRMRKAPTSRSVILDKGVNQDSKVTTDKLESLIDAIKLERR